MTQSLAENDEQIAQLVQKGNREAFGFLVERYQTKIKNYIRRFIQEQETTNDISQNVFLKAFANIQSFKPKLKFSPWLYRIAHNELVNYLKKKKELPLFDFDTFWPHLNPGKKEIENEAERKLILETFEKCFEQMPTKYKEVIVLYHLEGLSYTEIADVLQTPVATVGVRLKRAKQILQRICKNNKKLWNNQ